MKIKTILQNYRLSFGFTFCLILSEAVLAIFFPLFIGYAIDSAIHGSYAGAIQLGILGLVTLLVGVSRRVFDSRFYARVYQNFGSGIISNMESHVSSKKSARLGMIRELIEFLENALPELVSNVIGLMGVIIILYTLSLKVFVGSILVTCVVFLIYIFSRKKTLEYNKKVNDELEYQVDIIDSNDKTKLHRHLKEVMRWNIKLSDLEAVNFSLSWFVIMTFFIISILVTTGDGDLKYGVLFALIMYVFQYIESIIHLPFFYQNWLRLKEILYRLEERTTTANSVNK